MGLIGKAIERRSLVSTITSPGENLIEALNGGQSTASGRVVNPVSALQVGTVYSAIRIIAEAVRICPIVVERPAGNGRYIAAPDSRMQTLVGTTPNPEMPASEMWELIAGHMATHGNAFIFKERDAFGRVVRLWPLQPSQVLVGRYQRQKVYALQPWMDCGLPPYDLPPIGTAQDILHFRWFGTNGLVGLSPVRQLREDIGTEAAQQAFAGQVMANDARPGGILTTDQELTEQAAGRLLERWNASNKGKAGKVAVLEGGMKWQRTTMSLVDAQFVHQREISIQAIARGWRIPASMFLVAAGTSMTYSTTEQEGRGFLAYTMNPVFDRISSCLNADPDFQIEPGIRFRHLVEEIMNVETLTRLQGIALAVQTGWKSRNEARKDEGLEAVAGLDTYVDPHTQARLSGDLSMPAIQAALKAATGGGKTP